MSDAVRYIEDRDGRPKEVILPVDEYRALLDELEELSSVVAFDRAMAANETPIPFEQLLAEIRESEEDTAPGLEILKR